MSTVTPVTRCATEDEPNVAEENSAPEMPRVGTRVLDHVRLDRLLETSEGRTVFLADDEVRGEIVLVVVATSEDRLSEYLMRPANGALLARATYQSLHVAELTISESQFARFDNHIVALESPIWQENQTLASSVDGRPFDGSVFAGRYRVNELIGRGGMGDVYRAFDETFQREVALKIVRVGADDQGAGERRDEAKLRFLHEARVVSALKHPHIVEIFDAGESAGFPYLVLELCDGGNLRKVVRTGASYGDRLRWITEIAEALSYAHDHGIVHRDVKPENVLLTNAGIAKVADFGIAKALRQGRANYDTSSTIIGTPRYMAPEQLRGGAVDPRADQYAWGIVAHELLTESAPGPRDIRTLGTHGDFETNAPSLPMNLRRVLARAMTAKAGGRYPDMRALLADMQEPRKRRIWPGLVGATAAVLAIGGVAQSLHVRSTGTSTVPTASATTSAILDTDKIDAEMVSRCAPTAQHSFATGLQLWRDASQWEAVPKFDEATRVDPACAPASLYYLIAAVHTFPRRREQYRLARDQRAKLNDRERRLLEALEPTVADRHDYDEELRRAQEIAEQMPFDPDAQRIYGRALWHIERLDEALAVADRLAARYPSPIPGNEYFAATIQMSRGDDAAALERFDRCLKAAPDSGDCLLWKGRFLGLQGKCAEAESTLRHLTSVIPQSEPAHFSLANVVLASTRDPSAARGLFEERWHRLSANGYGPDPTPDLARLADEYRMAIVGGDLERALRLVRKWNEDIRSSNNGQFRGEPLVELIELLRELGYTQEARELSRKGLRELHSWTQDDIFDARIELARLGYLTSAIDAEQFRALRAEWLELHPHLTPVERWFGGYAGLPIVGADMAPPAKVGEYIADWQLMTPERFARAATELLRSGHVRDAVQHADAAADACSVLSARGFLHAQRASAQAHDVAHDTAIACKRYSRLQANLGKNPRSNSLQLAISRSKELACKQDALSKRK